MKKEPKPVTMVEVGGDWDLLATNSYHSIFFNLRWLKEEKKEIWLQVYLLLQDRPFMKKLDLVRLANPYASYSVPARKKGFSAILKQAAMNGTPFNLDCWQYLYQFPTVL